MYLNNFQSYIFGATLIFFLCFAACEKGILNGPLLSYGEKVELQKSQSILFGTDTKDGLKLTINNINDSRCPKDVNCIRAGEAAVKITIYDIKENSATFDLYYGDKSHFKPDTVNFSIDKKAYKVILFDVNPYPQTSTIQDSLKAKLTLLNN